MIRKYEIRLASTRSVQPEKCGGCNYQKRKLAERAKVPLKELAPNERQT